MRCLPGLSWSAFLLLTLTGCGSRSDTQANQETASAAIRPNLSFDNIILTESDQQGQGQLWELKAKKATYSRDGKLAVITGVEGVFFEKGQKSLFVQAKTGEIQTEKRILSLSGDVRAHSTTHRLAFTARQLRWLPDQNRIEAHDDLSVWDPTQKIRVTGQRMDGDLAANLLTITGNVRAVAQTQKVIIQSTKAAWYVQKSNLIAEQATAFGAQGQLSSPTINWDIQNRLLSTNQGLVYQRNQPSTRLTAHEGSWDQKNNWLTAQGDVNYYQGTMRVQGDQAKTNLAGYVRFSGKTITNLEAASIAGLK